MKGPAIFLHESGSIPEMLSKSRFNRRRHRLSDLFWALFNLLGETWKELNEDSIYIVDSFPVEGSQITGDKAYNDYGVEDLLQELGLQLPPLRKKNSNRS